MKHANIAIFIPHTGCPHKCSFCNQKSITGVYSQPSISEVKETIERAFKNLGNRAKNSEIAFFGGSFTAISKRYMLDLLDVAYEYIKKEMFFGIRISTRPDAINNEILKILKSRGVTSIELGAQSMNDKVLMLNEREHSAKDVIKASKRIKNFGFSLGLQMMTGLYGSNYKLDYDTGLKLALLKPDTMRIYPTVVMKNTKLANLIKNGKYILMSNDNTIKLCSELLVLFDKFKIKVIRLGLHDSENLRKNIIAGFFHPAFREICESRILFEKCILSFKNMTSKNIDLYVNSQNISKMIGQKKENLLKFKQKGYKVKVIKDNQLEKNDIKIQVSR